MATKSPTTNLYSILADPHATDSYTGEKRAAKTPAKGQEKDITPKERAEARAIENAAKQERREAEKARKIKEAEDQKAFAQLDDTGFSKQRGQRVKDFKTAKRTGVSEPEKTGKPGKAGSTKPKGPKPEGANKVANKDGQGPKANKPTGPKPLGASGAGFVAPKADKANGGKPKGPHHHVASAKATREHDKHSAGKASRHPQAKKAGAGKANWGESVPGAAAQVDTKAALQTIEKTTGDEWDAPGVVVNTPAAPAGEETEAVVPAADAVVNEEEESEDTGKTLDEYLAEQVHTKAALEQLVPSLNQPRQLTEDEKKSMAKFTVVENTKNAKAEVVKPASTTSTAKVSSNASARKGEKAVAADTVFQFRAHEPRPPRESRGRGGKRGEGRGEGRGGDRQQQQSPNAVRTRGGGRGGRKVRINQEQFPTLGSGKV